MAGKRAATSELNHDNWDEAEESEESGVFRSASKEELQRRVIRTGRRRTQAGGAAQDKNSVFSGFSGFNEAPASSFDFLSKLTNGGSGAAPNGTSAEKKDSGSPAGMFGSPVASSTALFSTSPGASGGKPSGLFSTNQMTSDSKSTTMFGTPSMSPTTVTTPTMSFGIPQKSTTPISSESKPAPMFGIPSQNSTMFGVSSNSSSPASASKPAPQMFGMPSQGASPSISTSSTMLGTTSKAETTPQFTGFKIPTVGTSPSATGSMIHADSNAKSNFNAGTEVKKTQSTDNSPIKVNKVQYYSKLKALNESVSDWIKKHVSDNPLCILTPIFRDYERYLKEIDEEFEPDTEKCRDEYPTDGSGENRNAFESKKTITDTPKRTVHVTLAATPSFMTTSGSNSSFSTKPITGFSLTSAAPSSAPFSFGINTAPQPTITTTPTPLAGAATPFSFGTGKGFSFNSNINQKPQEKSEEKEGEVEDGPPKVEFTPIVEENSVFDKRCKVFFKKDGNFVDKGVGTLYIKTIDNSSKHQVIVRANTSLGTVLLNFILNEFVPTQRMGKNNVMIVCVPTPESKPPPVSILLRVKTGDEADELLKTLNKYKT